MPNQIKVYKCIKEHTNDGGRAFHVGDTMVVSENFYMSAAFWQLDLVATETANDVDSD